MTAAGAMPDEHPAPVPAGTRSAMGTFPGLDGLRAVAALSVVATHLGTLSGRTFDSAWGPYLARADVGVAVFFLLSGFLLGGPFLRAVVDARPLPTTGAYLKRRALRIFPAYWLLFAWAALGAGIVGATRSGLASQFFLVHIYSTSTSLGPAIRSASGELGHPLGPAWTLAVEISFYLFLPVLAWFLVLLTRRRARAGRVRLVGATLALLWLGALVARFVVYRQASAETAGLASTWLPLNLDWFALGMGLTLVADAARAGRVPARVKRLFEAGWFPMASWALAALAFVAVSKWVGIVPAQLSFSLRESLARQLLYGAVAFFLLAPAVLGPLRHGVIRRTLAGFPLAQLGLISYGIYLWQDVVIDQYLRHSTHRYFSAPFWEAAAFVVAGSVVVATLSYWVVERPALALKDRRLLRGVGDRRRRH